jgi:hypothetical protein
MVHCQPDTFPCHPGAYLDILDFLLGCLEALSEWRMLLMIAIGIGLGALALIWVRPVSLSYIVAGTGFGASVIRGYYWQRAAERERL